MFLLYLNTWQKHCFIIQISHFNTYYVCARVQKFPQILRHWNVSFLINDCTLNRDTRIPESRRILLPMTWNITWIIDVKVPWTPKQNLTRRKCGRTSPGSKTRRKCNEMDFIVEYFWFAFLYPTWKGGAIWKWWILMLLWKCCVE